MKKILVTGGTGYIGSHTVLELLKADYDVIVIDNLSNSKIESLQRVEKLAKKKTKFIKLDLLDQQGLNDLFASNEIDSVIHFAGLKAVGESVKEPLLYYENNVTGSVNLCKAMDKFGVNNMVFSSSATVYGNPDKVPIDENAPLEAVNPYGRTKMTIEYILKDLHRSNDKWNIVILRYFNPIGADKSGLIGEDPEGIPNNLMPFVTQVAVGKLDKLKIFGGDYSTHDGTGVRDYIHVTDLARGHLKSLEAIEKNPGVSIYNLGTGKGYSVLDVVKAFEKATGIKISCKITERRPGDSAEVYAKPQKAKEELGWDAQKNLVDMCRDAWSWQSKNPAGY